MKFNTKEIYNAVVIEVIGKLMGGPEAEDFHNVLAKSISEDKKMVLVDLSDVKFVNSSGLGILVRGLTTMKTAGGDLRIAGISDKVKGVLSITKLTSVFKLYDSVEEAAKP
ncbi:MAG: STAS domain-containing protein [Bacteroidetes bacterium]|nr:STAS domain-containing protein [Bacteroidota bacterium]